MITDSSRHEQKNFRSALLSKKCRKSAQFHSWFPAEEHEFFSVKNSQAELASHRACLKSDRMSPELATASSPGVRFVARC
ncbi:hypothetical protein [Candidatus Electronema sp. JM]|uniref:hypothetical protein n=1 Tax=Candidatus Electronema sp. JM TaxID=3401571 RepID=UPI003AA91E49